MKYLKTIYSLQYPEVRETVEHLWLSRPHHLFDDNFLGKQEGKENHFFSTWANWSKEAVDLDIDKFPFQYVTAGSSEAIREAIWKIKQNNQRLVCFEGDYEGYKAFSESSDCTIYIHPRSDWKSIQWQDNDVLIMSNPSSIDACFWPEYDNFMTYLETNHPSVQVFLDLCYIGTTREHKLNLNYSNIHTIFISLSKVFGVYFHRIGGVISRSEIKGLFGNQWFKNMFALELGIKLMTKFSVFYFWTKYAREREAVMKQAQTDLNISFNPSDVFFLATSSTVLEEYKRLEISRICLTPALLSEIQDTNNKPWKYRSSGLDDSSAFNPLFNEMKSLLDARTNEGWKELYFKNFPEYKDDLSDIEFKTWIEICARSIVNVTRDEWKNYIKFSLTKILDLNNLERESGLASIANSISTRLTPEELRDIILPFLPALKLRKTVSTPLAALLRKDYLK